MSKLVVPVLPPSLRWRRSAARRFIWSPGRARRGATSLALAGRDADADKLELRVPADLRRPVPSVWADSRVTPRNPPQLPT
jgi:hypothetical protein